MLHPIIMKKHLLLTAALVSSFFILHSTLATPVYFPLIGITGAANNRDIIVIPDTATNVLTSGGNLVSLQTILIHPVRGNATNELLPWGYTMRVDGWARTLHFNVPDTNVVLNVVSLITNGLASYYPVGNANLGGNLDMGGNTISNAIINGGYFYGNYATVPVIAVTNPAIGRIMRITPREVFIANTNNSAYAQLYLDSGGDWFGGLFLQNSNGSQSILLTSSTGSGTFSGNVTAAGISGSSVTATSCITNNGLVWFAVATNALPSAVAAPNGSLATTTNGQFYVMSNAVWRLK